MMETKETVEKVVEFAQTETKTKIFRHDYPVSDELRKVMVSEVCRDFMMYALDQYYAEYLPMLKEYVDEHHPREEKRQILIRNLFWWRILYDSSVKVGSNCIEDYISENHHWLSKRPILISWLRECNRLIPKFYHVGYKYNDRVLVVTDILTAKTLDVIVYDQSAIPPKKGEIVMGTLIPLGDGLFFPIIDFYHFDFEARQELANHFFYYYDKCSKTSSMHEAFIHVLSSMLQIERLVFIDHQENPSSR
ncbi:hypothetical protein RCG23_24855 [Neobacillus sp. PS3-34]|uniref:hypothetical protein n=1 Tax=Neobacillus sp. PS3-34 TaxID=3070678 RepID=UPI0027E1C009|nr:hypothetical protein [Neobacillus sp. PS3-34]WML48428.1 hypothetical protein RCG23_24855 [Neobacillus sp. PS3-34]